MRALILQYVTIYPALHQHKLHLYVPHAPFFPLVFFFPSPSFFVFFSHSCLIFGHIMQSFNLQAFSSTCYGTFTSLLNRKRALFGCLYFNFVCIFSAHWIECQWRFLYIFLFQWRGDSIFQKYYQQLLFCDIIHSFGLPLPCVCPFFCVVVLSQIKN